MARSSTVETGGPESMAFGTTRLPTNPMEYTNVARKIR